MMPLHVQEGPWVLGVTAEYGPATFVAVGVLSDVETASDVSSGRAMVRSVVELRFVGGGLRPSGLLGAEFTPQPSAGIRFEVEHSVPLDYPGAAATCPSLTGGPSLVPGLPQDFAQPALDGLMRVQCVNPLPAGLLRVNRAGYDEVNSGELVFERAAGLLRCVLSAATRGEAPDEGELRKLMRG